MKHRYGKLTAKEAILDFDTGVAWLFVRQDWDDKSIQGAKDECWEWCGAKHRDGYGLIYTHQLGEDLKSNNMSAQRLAKAIELNRPLKHEERVIATCRNKACTNPNHLIIGTQLSQYDYLRATTALRKTLQLPK